MRFKLLKRLREKIDQDPVLALFYKNVISELKNYKKQLIIIQVVGIIGLGFGAVIPYLFKKLTDSLMAGDMDILLYVPPLLIVLTMSMVTVRVIKRIMTESVSLKITASQQKSIINHYMHGPFLSSFTEGRADKITHLIHDIQSFVSGIMIFFSNALYIPLMLVVYISLLFFTEWRIALVALLVFPPLYFLLRFFSKRVKKTTARMHEAHARFYGFLHELFGGFELIKAIGAAPAEQQRLVSVQGELIDSSLRNSVVTAAQSGLMRITNAAFLCVVSWVAFYLLTDNGSGFTASEFVQFLAILVLLFDELVKVGSVVQQVNQAVVSSHRLQGVLPQYQVKQQGIDLLHKELDKGITINNLAFSYKNHPVFQSFSGTIRPGEFVAVIGESGVGKTTLTRLLCGLLEPDSGSVEVDGVAVHRLTDSSRENLISYAPQRPVIFSSTVFNNVRYGNGECSRQDAENALNIASAMHFVENLPQGIDTVIGDGGHQLSVGQLQRVALARAIAGKQPILLLDETFSNIDVDTEQRIYQGLRSIKGKTVILVTHRLQTIEDADTIITVENCMVQSKKGVSVG